MEADWVELVLEYGMLWESEVLKRRLFVIGMEEMKMEFEFGLELGLSFGFELELNFGMQFQ